MPTALSMALKTLSTVPLLKLRPLLAPAAHLHLDLGRRDDRRARLGDEAAQREVVLALADLFADERLQVERP